MNLAHRGHPLYFLAALLLVWLAARALIWNEHGGAGWNGQAPGSFVQTGGSFSIGKSAGRGLGRQAQSDASLSDSLAVTDNQSGGRERGGPGAVPQPLPGLVPARVTVLLSPRPLGPASLRRLSTPVAGPGNRAIEAQRTVRAAQDNRGAALAVGHTLMTMMGLSQMRLPPHFAALVGSGRPGGNDELRAGRRARAASALAGAGPEPLAPARVTGDKRIGRWAADGWVFVREGGVRATVPGQPSYGRSQAGAVLRYRLAPTSRHAPQAYVRASSAFERPRDAELAAGLSARPIARLPIRLAAELRLADRAVDTELRPAAYVVTELAPIDLPFAARAEFYAQAGYVAGDFATPFVDGQARLTRDFARAGPARLSAGIGAWGGAQEGAARLDVGPTASASFSIGRVFARASADYRVRVAGDAAPDHGPALTLSAGF